MFTSFHRTPPCLPDSDIVAGMKRAKEKHGFTRGITGLLLLYLGLLPMLSGCGGSSGEGKARPIIVEAVTGDVRASRSGESWSVYEGLTLVSGDNLQVPEDGSIILLLDTDRHFYADEGALFRIEAEGQPGDGRTVITVEKGTAIAGEDGKPTDQDPLILNTPQACVTVTEKGTVFSASITRAEGDPATQLEVVQGEVQVRTVLGGAERTQTLTTGKTGTYSGTSPSLTDTEEIEDKPPGSAEDHTEMEEKEQGTVTMTTKEAQRHNLMNVLIQIGRIVVIFIILLFLYKFFAG